MLLESLSDFFLFISTDKKVITEKDLRAFEYFIKKQFPNIDPQNSQKISSQDLNSSTSSIPKLTKSINSFLSEFIFYLYTQNIIQLDSNHQHLIESKSIDIYKQRFSTSNGSNNNNNIYQEQQRKHIQLKQIKNKETKKVLIQLLKENKLNFSINPSYYIGFFNYTGKYAKVISEFMNKMKKWHDLYKVMLDKNKARISDDKSNLSDDKSNYDNKSGLSGISFDKENIVKDKKKFLEVLDKMRSDNTKENFVDENDVNVEIDDNINKNKEINKHQEENDEYINNLNKSKDNNKNLSNNANIVVPSDISNSNIEDVNRKNHNNINKRKQNKDDCVQCCITF